MKYAITVDTQMTPKELEECLKEKKVSMETIEQIDAFDGKIVDIISWHEGDIKAALIKNGVVPTKENVEVVANRFNSIHQIMVGNSNEVLEDSVLSIKHEGAFK